MYYGPDEGVEDENIASMARFGMIFFSHLNCHHPTCPASNSRIYGLRYLKCDSIQPWQPQLLTTGEM